MYYLWLILKKWFTVRQTSGVVLNPEYYANAGGELLVVALLTAWLLTSLYRPDMIVSNPLKDRVGYNNLCVGWDAAPAKLFVAPMYALIVVLQFRGLQFDFWRSSIDRTLTDGLYKAVAAANMLCMLSWFISALIFVVEPRENPNIHSGAFVQLVFFMYVQFVVNILENDVQRQRRGYRVFLLFYTLTTGGFISCAVIQLATYDEATQTPGPIPWYVTATFDYLWFVSLPISGAMRPSAPSLKITLEAVHDDDSNVVNLEAIKLGDDSEGMSTHLQ
eukprot:TRINITY_DN6821_c0_g1_i1.p2 TRINITY_DN6821_c0_g1~~TRINITY_DN6821_c0_g1_i1.p2  ORF type:complete len:276 (-),score=37.08 TRINITY_DN6821_c0_g1_i1:140-967(-)